MIPGLVTALLKAESICQPASGNSDRNRLAVLEVDEGSLLPLSRLITEVDLVMVTNLFRPVRPLRLSHRLGPTDERSLCCLARGNLAAER